RQFVVNEFVVGEFILGELVLGEFLIGKVIREQRQARARDAVAGGIKVVRVGGILIVDFLGEFLIWEVNTAIVAALGQWRPHWIGPGLRKIGTGDTVAIFIQEVWIAFVFFVDGLRLLPEIEVITVE